jgi:putative membrane-bound dehydrogenase-like protein
MKFSALFAPLRFIAVLFFFMASQCSAAAPRVLVDDCELEQIAREPAIATPVGMAFDGAGRLLVVESHTHQRTESYDGPTSDRLRMLSDSDGDGQLDRWSTFAEGFRHAMNVAVRDDGAVYVVTRSDVHLLRDTSGDGVADENQKVVELKTTIDYPHNALSGIIIAGDQLYLGVGENFGVEYDLFGSDGRSIKNTGGVGMIYRGQLDGSQLERYAEGFWNPFSLCRAGGRLFCVDNDPDASPPCRLIDVVERGDYGFRFDFGRAGVHPLQAWNGELPGTMPMVCGTGEAPTAVLFHRGYLWVTSWGDYRVERYRLTPQDNGIYAAERTIVVQGDADFRPTGMAAAPDGSLWFGDWVDRSYPVHAKGRIWRLELPAGMQTDFEPIPSDPQVLAQTELENLLQIRWEQSTPRASLIEILRTALDDSDPNVRLFAVRWAAQQRLAELRPQIEKLLSVPPVSERYFLAVLAALDWLGEQSEPGKPGISDKLLIKELNNPSRGPDIKALALNSLSPDHPDLTLDRLAEDARADYEPLQLAAVRTITQRTDEARYPVLEKLAREDSLKEAVRVEAVAGLAAKAAEYRELLESLAESSGELDREATRILRLSGIAPPTQEEKPDAGDLAAWAKLLAEPGDAAAGRRLFYSAVGPKCSVCHRHSGRGGTIGPDLTTIGAATSRERIISSILVPSRDVAPHYETWILVTDDGKSHVGQRLPKAGDDGREPYADPNGERFELSSDSIVHREATKTSIMPAGLEKSISIEDLRDLVTFLKE